MDQEVAEPLHNGRYRLQRVLGSGGMATVYAAWDNLLHLHRAIKVLSPALSKRRTIRERFLLEARSMARLESKNVVKVFDFGQDGERVFLVMEVVDGGNLIDRVQLHGPIPPRELCAIVAGALDGLAAAHAAGFVHRDVKPHNILLASDGTPKLTDFGIAQARHQEMSLTRTGAVMGTWAYMAPEQRTDARRADPRSDLYSMGATLYACATGAEPFDLYVDQVAQTIAQRMPAALAAVVVKSTRYSPEDRYESANEMADVLRALASVDLSIAPAPPSSISDSTTFTADSLYDNGPAHSIAQSSAPDDAEPAPTQLSRRWPWLLLPVSAMLVAAAWMAFDAKPRPEPPVPDIAPVTVSPTRSEDLLLEEVPEAPEPREVPVAPAPEPVAPTKVAPRTEPKPAAEPRPTPPAEEPPAARPEPTPRPAGPPARLFLNSEPYSVVSVDGQELGRTPIRGREVPGGRHSIVFRSSDGRESRRTVDVPGGEIYRLCWDLNLESPCP